MGFRALLTSPHICGCCNEDGLPGRSTWEPPAYREKKQKEGTSPCFLLQLCRFPLSPPSGRAYACRAPAGRAAECPGRAGSPEAARQWLANWDREELVPKPSASRTAMPKSAEPSHTVLDFPSLDFIPSSCVVGPDLGSYSSFHL